MKRVLSIALVIAMLLGCVAALAGCGTTESAMTICLGPVPDTIDPALNSAVDGASYIIHLFSGLVGYEQDESGNLVLVPGCAKEIPTAVETADGKVSYTFVLKDDLKWSDGTALTAADFVWSWNRAADPATAADYGYMFDVIDGYAEMQEMYKVKDDGSIETDADGNFVYVDGRKELNAVASEDGKSITVTLNVDVPYFMELLAFPTYMPVKKDIVEANSDSWATKAETYVGNGAYKVTEFTNAQLVLEKNENYWGAEEVVSDKIICAFNEDDASILANYKNGSYLFIDSVPQDEIETLEKDYPEEYQVVGQLGTYYVCFNMNDVAFKDFTEEEKTKIRLALGLMIDRNYIVEEIGKAGQVPAAGFVAMGLTEPDGKEFISKNGPNGDGAGYYSVDEADYTANCDEAVKLLEEVAQSSGKFTVADKKVSGFPTITYITNEGTGHEAIATYLQETWKGYGIETKIETQEWGTFLNTRKNGDYSVARNGWLGDYNDPISFLDMWLTSSGNNDCQFGKGEHANYAGYTYKGETGKTWAESYDALINEIKTSKDQNLRFELMHDAEDILMSTGAICPIYYYTDIYMCSESLDGFFCSPLGYKYFMFASVKAAE